MKEISQMTLTECIEALQSLEEFTLLKDIDTSNFEPTYDSMKQNAVELADRIHDLTRWIPVSERMPTEGDYSEAGQIHLWDAEFGICRVYHKDIAHDFLKRIPLEFTHWQRITSPEGA